MVQLTYRLKDYGNPVLTPGQALGDINGYPVLNSNLAKVNYSVRMLYVLRLIQNLSSYFISIAYNPIKQLAFIEIEYVHTVHK